MTINKREAQGKGKKMKKTTKNTVEEMRETWLAKVKVGFCAEHYDSEKAFGHHDNWVTFETLLHNKAIEFVDTVEFGAAWMTPEEMAQHVNNDTLDQYMYEHKPTGRYNTQHWEWRADWNEFRLVETIPYYRIAQ